MYNLFDNLQKQIKIEGKSNKEIANKLKKEIVKLFPFVTFSVTSKHLIRLTIVKAPFKEDSLLMDNLIKSLKNIVCSDFIHISISYKFEELTVDENIKNILDQYNKDYDNYIQKMKLEAQKQASEYLKQREIEIQKQKEENEKIMQQKQYINENINIIEVENRYIINNVCFPSLNKLNNMDDYIKQMESINYDNENVEITKEIHFNDIIGLEYFENMLLEDFDFLKCSEQIPTGGSYTNDERIQKCEDIGKFTQDEISSMQWFAFGVAIYFENEIKFIINTEGCSYARYVGFIKKERKVNMKYLDFGTVEFENKEYVLQEQASYSFYKEDTYQAMAIGEDEKKYLIYWNMLEDYKNGTEEYQEDEEKSCDWDAPSGVEEIE